MFRNYEEQYEENKRWDELSRLPELHFHSRMLSDANSKKQKDHDNGTIAVFDPSQESVQVFIGKPGFEDIALLINAEYNIKKASLLEGKNICCYESLLIWQRYDPLGTSTVSLNDKPEVLKRLGIAVNVAR